MKKSILYLITLLVLISTSMSSQIVPIQRDVPDKNFITQSRGELPSLLTRSGSYTARFLSDPFQAITVGKRNFRPSEEIEGKRMRLDSVTIDELDEFGDFVYAEKLAFTYDQYNRDVAFEIYQREDAEPWQGMMRTTYAYDQQGRYTEVTMYQWSFGANNWVPQHQSRYTYRGSDAWEVVSYYYEYGDWNVEWKEEYLLDAKGRPSEFITSEWNATNSGWDPMERISYVYDEDDHLYQMLFAFWDMSAMKFIDNWMYEYHYDTYGRLYNEWFILIDSEMGTFFTYRKTFYQYDFENRVTQVVDKDWDQAVLDWINTYRRWNEYDNAGNLAEFGEQFWDRPSAAWFDEYKDVLKYNNNFSHEELLLPGVLTGELLEDESWFNHMLVGLEEWSFVPEDDEWFLMIDGKFYYSDLTTNTGIYTSADVNVFPVPANELLNVEFDEDGIIQLFDLNGSLLLQREHTPPLSSVYIGSRVDGMYILQLVGKGKFATRKVTVQSN